MMIYQQDTFKLDSDRVTDETHPVFGDMTVFHDVVIASEIVQPYEDGKAWKPRDELEAYAWTVDGRWIMVGGHPADGIISERDQVSGRTVNPRYVKDLKDPATKRPNRAGVRADIQIFNNKVAPKLLADMKNGEKQDVSIGFFFNKDDAPGVVESDSCKGQEYDYVQRNMFHDHLAAGIDNGRCPSPLCGLGADEVIRQVIGDPFAGFKNWEDCKSTIGSNNPDLSDEQVEAICGKLKSEHEDRLLEETVLTKTKDRIRLLLEEEYETIKGEVLSLKEQKEGDWWRRIDWTTENHREIYNDLADEIKVLIIEAGLCPDCSEADEECEEGYEKNEEGECVKIEEAEDVKESNPGFHNKGEEAEGECPEGHEWNEEQGKCVKIENFSKKDTVDKLDPYEVLSRYNKATQR